MSLGIVDKVTTSKFNCFESAASNIIPVQISINAINQKIVPGHDFNNRFGAWNIVGVIIGSIFWVSVLIGFFYHPEQK